MVYLCLVWLLLPTALPLSPSPQVQPHNVPQQFVLNKLAKNQPAFFVFISTSTILIMCDDTTLLPAEGDKTTSNL